MRIQELLDHFQLETAAPPVSDFEILGVRPLGEAGPGELSFLANPKYREEALRTRASAVLLREPLPGLEAVQILCKDPYLTLARVMQRLYPEPRPEPGVHASAVVEPGAEIPADCHVGPHCSIAAGTVLGSGCVLHAGVRIGRDCRLGEDVVLFPNVVLYPRTEVGDGVRIHANCVIGGDGFGYAQDERGQHVKIPQIGRVRIEAEVEIGCNTTVDRGTLDDTVIGRGTIVDNQVQIGHGVKVGAHSILVSQVGISGSAAIGDHSVLAGKVGVVGHVTIGDRVLVMGDSVVTKNLEKSGRYAGNPAIPHLQYQRQQASLRKLPELRERLKQLEAALREAKG